MTGQRIIMNFTVPPSAEDLEVMAASIMESLPDELAQECEEAAIRVDEIPDEAVESELDLEHSYELLALYRSGKEISPGVEKKTANDDDILILYRRPLLDIWCENGDDLMTLLRHVIVEELGRHFEFSEDDIEDMSQRVQNLA